MIMYQVIDNSSSGKTSRLMLLAKEHNGILVCANPYAMKTKARAYGLTGFEIISYEEYFNNQWKEPCFIDELDQCLKYLGNNVTGYSLTLEK
jgi:hypothetical protein